MDIISYDIGMVRYMRVVRKNTYVPSGPARALLSLPIGLSSYASCESIRKYTTDHPGGLASLNAARP
jgi:hypothetical protein